MISFLRRSLLPPSPPPFLPSSFVYVSNSSFFCLFVFSSSSFIHYNSIQARAVLYMLQVYSNMDAALAAALAALLAASAAAASAQQDGERVPETRQTAVITDIENMFKASLLQ
jgi:hypothetical protein